MRAKAQELVIEKLRTTAQPPESPPAGEGITKGVDFSKMSDSEKMGWAIENIAKNK